MSMQLFIPYHAKQYHVLPERLDVAFAATFDLDLLYNDIPANFTVSCQLVGMGAVKRLAERLSVNRLVN